ncbi:hypothetical protein DPMN_117631 [Dreissena polymorpha]|uniref:Uncharacterized protein n=1 Tax=Dreissena polymorpha TaxID=45954 RepID=A0A9D4JPF9_DREPO|nr:hypothetical protein DPMN_117631 [Dreissena polymorpha]
MSRRGQWTRRLTRHDTTRHDTKSWLRQYLGFSPKTAELNIKQHIIELDLDIIQTQLLNKLVFDPAGPIFELDLDIIKTQLLTKFDVIETQLLTKFDIIGTNLLTKFHEDRKINVATRVHIRKNAPPPGSHVFQPTGIIF